MRPIEANERPGSDSALETDTVLRRSLDPDAATVERLVHGALTAADAPQRLRGGWRLAAAALVVVVVIALPTWFLRGPPPSPIDLTTPTGAPAILRISNEDGPVTVTTPAGSKLVLLPIIPLPGDAS